ncbi:MAG: hypothetical protein L3J07_03500 [Candidatus Magasanikbacteria bacterium]|nr:hypothetical protein [Candidatus Magasanikbacteria bacterium]
MKFSSKNPLNEALRLMKHCPLCKQDYIVEKAKIVQKQNEAHLIHITCDNCENAVLVLLVISQLGVSSIGIITDLVLKDMQKFLLKNVITEDDLLNFHELLENKQSLFIKSLIG